MSVDKLVDSAQLDSALTSVANAIRIKGGTSASLAFPDDFISAINAISGGGGWSSDDIATNSAPNGDIVLGSGVTVVANNAFLAKPITSIVGQNVTEIKASSFSYCTHLLSASFPNLTKISGGNTFRYDTALQEIYFPKLETLSTSYVFGGCTNLHIGVFPSLTSQVQSLRGANFYTIDLGKKVSIGNYWFSENANLSVLILRSAELCPLTNIGGFSNTCFASGNSGGTLYVPSALLSSYQSASNWTTILGYTNNQIKTIESTHTDPNAPFDMTIYYADGTLIPT